MNNYVNLTFKTKTKKIKIQTEHICACFISACISQG